MWVKQFEKTLDISDNLKVPYDGDYLFLCSSATNKFRLFMREYYRDESYTNLYTSAYSVNTPAQKQGLTAHFSKFSDGKGLYEVDIHGTTAFATTTAKYSMLISPESVYVGFSLISSESNEPVNVSIYKRVD